MELKITKADLLVLLRKQLAAVQAYEAEASKRQAAAEEAWLREVRREAALFAKAAREAKTPEALAGGRYWRGRLHGIEKRWPSPPEPPQSVAHRMAGVIRLVEREQRDELRIRDTTDGDVRWALCWAPDGA